jgi:hypothetical protein
MSSVSAQAALQRARSHSEPGMAVRTCSAERRRVRPPPSGPRSFQWEATPSDLYYMA